MVISTISLILLNCLVSLPSLDAYPDDSSENHVIVDTLTFHIQEDPQESIKSPPKVEPPQPPRPLVPMHASESECPGIVCYVIRFQQTGESFLDCSSKLPPSENGTLLQILICTYWQPPETDLVPAAARFFHQRSAQVSEDEDSYLPSHSQPVRIRLKPQQEKIGSNVAQRIHTNGLKPGALIRLCLALRLHLDLSTQTQLKLSLIMIKIRRLSFIDLANLFAEVNLTNLVLWNPHEMEETSMLQSTPLDPNLKLSFRTFVRLTFYCEADNDAPAFGLLWLPWARWQLRFKQCKGHYTCFRWPQDEALCCTGDRCPETPQFAITHYDQLSNQIQSRLKNHNEQILTGDDHSCDMEPNLSDPLLQLKRRDTCWELPNGLSTTTTTETKHTLVSSTDSSIKKTLVEFSLSENEAEESATTVDEIIPHVNENAVDYHHIATISNEIIENVSLVTTPDTHLNAPDPFKKYSKVEVIPDFRVEDTDATKEAVHEKNDLNTVEHESGPSREVKNVPKPEIPDNVRLQIIEQRELEDREAIRSLVTGIICLLVLNFITFIIFIAACCWFRKKWKQRRLSRDLNNHTGSNFSGSYVRSGTFDKLDCLFDYPTSRPFYFHDLLGSPEIEASRGDYLTNFRFAPVGSGVSGASTFGTPIFDRKLSLLDRMRYGVGQPKAKHTLVIEGPRPAPQPL